MQESNITEPEITDSFVRPHGFEFDREQSFRKLSSHQFGGNPARGFCELLQNAIDSYGDELPVAKRKIRIETSDGTITVSDSGEGMNRDRIRLITTLGGTDKQGSKMKIGQFGIGFFSLFNPVLGARRIEVDTLCEGRRVTVIFKIDQHNPGSLPQLEISDTDPLPDQRGSRVRVVFGDADVVDSCIAAASRFLRYLPCEVRINDLLFRESVWRNTSSSAKEFEINGAHGIIDKLKSSGRVKVLCRYELVYERKLEELLGHNVFNNNKLRSRHQKEFPYLDGSETVINANDLEVTVSRDSLSRNHAFNRMIDTLRHVHFGVLDQCLKEGECSSDVYVANQYILIQDVAEYLARGKSADLDSTRKRIAEALAHKAVYQLHGKKRFYSLADLREEIPERRPAFYSLKASCDRWACGALRDNNIILPPQVSLGHSLNDLYVQILGTIFGEAINLATLETDQGRFEALTARKLIDPDKLKMECTIVGCRQLSDAEAGFLEELNALLLHPPVVEVVRRQLQLPVNEIRANFYELNGKQMTVAAGLFEDDGKLYDNLRDSSNKENSNDPTENRPLQIGLMRNHPVVRHLVTVNDRFRACYTLCYLAHQLVRCQQRLTLYSSFSDHVTCILVQQMRKVLVEYLLENIERSP